MLSDPHSEVRVASLNKYPPCSVGLVDMTLGSQPREEGFNSPTECVFLLKKDIWEWTFLETKMYMALIFRKWGINHKQG